MFIKPYEEAHNRSKIDLYQLKFKVFLRFLGYNDPKIRGPHEI